jgi:hypothetical protein
MAQCHIQWLYLAVHGCKTYMNLPQGGPTPATRPLKHCGLSWSHPAQPQRGAQLRPLGHSGTQVCHGATSPAPGDTRGAQLWPLGHSGTPVCHGARQPSPKGAQLRPLGHSGTPVCHGATRPSPRGTQLWPLGHSGTPICHGATSSAPGGPNSGHSATQALRPMIKNST